MSLLRIFCYVIAAGLISIGWLALLFHQPVVITAVCLLSFTLVIMTRSEWMNPLSSRDLWVMFLCVTGLVVFILLAHLGAAGESPPPVRRLVHHPAFVIPLWLLMLGMLYRRWLREKNQADAADTTKK